MDCSLSTRWYPTNHDCCRSSIPLRNVQQRRTEAVRLHQDRALEMTTLVPSGRYIRAAALERFPSSAKTSGGYMHRRIAAVAWVAMTSAPNGAKRLPATYKVRDHTAAQPSKSQQEKFLKTRIDWTHAMNQLGERRGCSARSSTTRTPARCGQHGYGSVEPRRLVEPVIILDLTRVDWPAPRSSLRRGIRCFWTANQRTWLRPRGGFPLELRAS
jgi:hypothetical protein